MAGVVLKADREQMMWLHIFANNNRDELGKADKLHLTQVEVIALKRQIEQLEAVIVAIQRGLVVSGPDLIVGRFFISLADINIAVRKRQITWETFEQTGKYLRGWLARELHTRGFAA